MITQHTSAAPDHINNGATFALLYYEPDDVIIMGVFPQHYWKWEELWQTFCYIQ